MTRETAGTHRTDDIDALYGLEPVIDVSQGASDHVLDQFTEVQCPYCAELMLIRLDLSAGAQAYVEDCQVCCQAMQIGVDVADDGTLDNVRAERLDR